MRNLKLNSGGAIGVVLALVGLFLLKAWWFKNGTSTLPIPTFLIVFIMGIAGNFLGNVIEFTYMSMSGQLLSEEEYEAKQNEQSFMSEERGEERQELLKRLRERGIGGSE